MMKTVKKLGLLLLVAAASNSATAQNKVVLGAGTPYTITSAAEVSSSGGTVLYQWYRNGSKVEGATGLSYTVPTEEAVGSDVQFKRAAYLEGCEERKFSNPFTITWCNLKVGETCWADVNVAQPGTFAPRPDMFTEFYQWGQPDKAWDPQQPGATVPIEGWNATITVPAWPSTPCPTGWRLPTWAEFQALGNPDWVSSGTRGTAFSGAFFGPNRTTCVLHSAMSGCIFLPLTGSREASNGSLYNYQYAGIYWTSTPYNSTTAYYFLLFLNEYINNSARSNKAAAMAIRCVQ